MSESCVLDLGIWRKVVPSSYRIFLGGKMMHWILGPGGSELFNGLSRSDILVVGKLAWGLLFGLGFGAGIGYAFHNAQDEEAP
jgi:hypothetical protein